MYGPHKHGLAIGPAEYKCTTNMNKMSSSSLASTSHLGMQI